MNEKITLQDIINLLCEKQGMTPKDAETFVRTMFDLIEEALTNEKYIKIKGLGTFKLTEVNSRESVHVNTGERIEIQGHSKVSFTPDTSMKELINKPFSHFETVVLNEGVELEDTVIEEEGTPESTEVSETTIKVEETTIGQHIVEESVVEKPIVETPAIEEPTIQESMTEEPIEENSIMNEPVMEAPIVEETDSEVPVEPTIVEETIATEVLKSTESEESEKPITAEKEEVSTPMVPQGEEKKSSRILWAIIIALVLIILFGFYWLFMRPSTSTEIDLTVPAKEEAIASTPIEEEKQPEDTLEILSYVKLSAEELRNERVPSLADTLDYQIIGTKEEYTLQKGETIIRASVKFFGSKKYWPYIVKYNMDVLKDPDNIPAGAQVKIPILTPKK
jgi:nucleoid DNA-binding protein